MKVRMGGKSRDIPAVWWEDGKVLAIDQTRLPGTLRITKISDHRDVALAIKKMVVRGAPTIGATAAYGLALAWKNGESIRRAVKLLISTRPTAYDLFFALDWMLDRMEEPIESAIEYASSITGQCRKIGEYGAKLVRNGSTVLTHCNAGALATVDFGTALAPLRIAHRGGKSPMVLVDETRPRLQGAKLTSWELMNEGIEHAIIVDNAAGHYLKSEIDLVIVGADRIAKNGDAANKIGTYEKAVVAKENGVPFYVAAPMSTFDPNIAGERDIPIEERDQSEVLRIGRERIGPPRVAARNPAFDITPARYITGFITEKGIRKPSEIAGLIGKR
ncbi:MAG TPA: S-methyl-5-thioribose-1-phosphate isomerase [Euryarchaeota archaeon]|nr:S-methyl-5-thioribose-1-phosphate isomerase [Euryarchaeota archaeon]